MNSTTLKIRYDDALGNLAKSIQEVLGLKALEENLILRDAEGLLTFVRRTEIPPEKIENLKNLIRKRVGSYAAQPEIATPDELFDSRLSDPDEDEWELVSTSNSEPFYIRYVERRIVGNDWVRGIFPKIDGSAPVIVFASHKGGVGRSTALTIAAQAFAKLGKSILAVDLDLEAPGIGGMLLKPEEIPLYGAIDYYVECGRSEIDTEFMQNMKSISSVGEWPGKITIVPAAGTACQENPQNVLGKISRAYLETDLPAAPQGSFLDKTRQMIADLSRTDKYDAVFIDARAGLNESTATTIQGLGADVLFFGIDTPQTWEGYRYFLSHLARFKSKATQENDWRYKIKMVHAKAIGTPTSLKNFRDSSFELFAEHLYDEIGEDETAQGLVDAFGFDLDDRYAPHYAWPIYLDPDYHEFNPTQNADQLDSERIEKTFGEFLKNLSERLDIP